MRILFLMIAYPEPEINSSMYTDLAGLFARKGFETYVVVGNGPRETSLRIENGVNVLRVSTLELFNTSLIKKGIANVLLPYQISISIKKYLKDLRFDTVILATPPITYLDTVRWLKRKHSARVYLILRDIFPQNAKDMGMIKSSLLLRYFKKKEEKLYEIADHIGCMSPGNILYIRTHNPGVSEQKLHLLPNWTDLSENSDPDLKIRQRFGLENKFVALYGGNLGKPQDVGFIIELADSLRSSDDVVFLIAGDGTEKNYMIRETIRRKLTNVMFIDNLPRSEYHDLAKVCDIGLVNISKKMTIPNIPSRTLSYWNAKIPVLAAIDENTDFNRILEESESGLWCLTGDLDAYKNKFNELYQNRDLRQLMGENGHKYLVRHCTTENAFSTIFSKISS